MEIATTPFSWSSTAVSERVIIIIIIITVMAQLTSLLFGWTRRLDW